MEEHQTGELEVSFVARKPQEKTDPGDCMISHTVVLARRMSVEEAERLVYHREENMEERYPRDRRYCEGMKGAFIAPLSEFCRRNST
jgi:hypothetical protein